MISSPRWPIYIPSKGRSDRQTALTAKALLRDDVPFRLVVEPQEQEAYEALAGPDHVLVLPFSNLGLGSIPARNWIRDHAETEGHERHWQLDDNISMFYRLWDGERVPMHAGVALRVCEDLTDRFANVGVSGLNYTMFVPRDTKVPYYVHTHVYSATLVNHAMPYRWRGRYNEDTDLCLQALVNGWATLLVNAVNAQKAGTMFMKGGNSDELYRTGDGEQAIDVRDTMGRYEMARVLERAWPGLVKVTRKFRRYQHSVNWGAFDFPLIPRDNVDLDALPEVDEYGMTLRVVRDGGDDPRLEALRGSYEAGVATAVAPDPFWRGLPAFRPARTPPQVRIVCASEEERAQLIKDLGVTIAKKTNGTWSAWYPPRPRGKFGTLRFEPEPTHEERTPDAERLHGDGPDVSGEEQRALSAASAGPSERDPDETRGV
jgi:hypothetical protein